MIEPVCPLKCWNSTGSLEDIFKVDFNGFYSPGVTYLVATELLFCFCNSGESLGMICTLSFGRPEVDDRISFIGQYLQDLDR